MKSKKINLGMNDDINREDIAEYILSEERTVLSKQRTALAFIQTGFAAVGAGLIVVKFWEDALFRYTGVILMIFGFYEIVKAYPKLLKYEKRLDRVKDLVKKSKWGKYEYEPV